MSIIDCVVSNVIVATGLAAVAVLAGRISTRPQIRHVLWILVLVKLVTPPLVRIPVSAPFVATEVTASPTGSATELEPGLVSSNITEPHEHHGQSEASGTTLPETPVLPSAARKTPNMGVGSPPFIARVPWSKVLLGVWGAGTLLWFTLAAVRLLRFRKMLQYAHPASEKLESQVRAIAGRYDLRRIPEILIVDAKVPPMMWAFGRRARMVLPSGLLDTMGHDEQAGLLAHELAHLKRRDHWIRWFEFVVLGIYWWNPIAWWARANIQQAEEECCDAWVLWAFPDNTGDYAQALVNTVDLLAGSAASKPEIATAFSQGTCLKRRIEMIIGTKAGRTLSWKMRGVLVMLALIVAPLSLFGSQNENDDKNEATHGANGAASRSEKPTSNDDTAVPAEKRNGESGRVSSEEASRVFRTATAAIEDNYKSLKRVAVTYETLNVTPSVEQRKEISGESADGGTRYSYTVAPVYVRRRSVIIDGPDVRYDSYERVGNEWTHEETMWRKGDTWSRFLPKSNSFDARQTSQLGSFLPADPRDFGGLDQRHGLLDQMRRSKAISVSRKGRIIEVVAEIVHRPKYGYEPGQRFTYWFDTQRNYLPTQVIRHHADGTVNVLSELSYEEVVPGKFWFVRGFTRKYFDLDAGAKDPDSNTWHQLVVYKAVGPIRLNEEQDDVFRIDVPRDTRARAYRY